MLSSSEIVWTQVDVLPHASVAVQVRVMIGSAGHRPDTVISACVIPVTILQASVAVACPVAEGAELAAQSMVILGGQVSTGPVLSTTTMTWLHVAVLLQLSVAVQVRVIVFSARHDPGAI